MLKEKILNLISKDSLAHNKPSNLFCLMAKTFGVSEKTIREEFDALVNNGDIYEVKKGKFIPIPSQGYEKGRFIGNARGFGFVQLGSVKGENDIFISPNKTNGAIDGDKVIVKVSYKNSEGSDGEVVKIYQCAPNIVGVVEKVGETYFLEPDNNHIPYKFMVQKANNQLLEDMRVIASIVRDKNKMVCRIEEILGKSDDIKAMEKGIIKSHDFYETFPENVLNECDKFGLSVKESQLKGRVDLREEEIFTIDGEDAQDFDDAVSIKRNGKGYILGVHIADVGEYVKKGSALDEEAFNRATSVYFPTSVLPMLPEKLSNGICSLSEGVDRLTISCVMEIDENCIVTSHKIFESVIRSKARLTYTEANKIFTGEKSEKTETVKESLLIMKELSKKLQDKKGSEGYLDFEIPESEFIFNEDGLAVDVKRRERNSAHRLIEDFMVLANEVVAKDFSSKDIPFVYRVHEAPRKEKLIKALDFLKGLGLQVPKIPDVITPSYYQSLLKLIEGHDYTETVNKVLLRSMQKAKYVNKNLGHFGLALENYCHFTSPIRRYPDLTIHRIIKEVLRSKKLSAARDEELKSFTYESSQQSSERERGAELAEREVDDLWKAYIMKDHIGEEFQGVITSVTNYGIYVELENTVEGLVRIEDLPEDDYLFFEKALMIKGSKNRFKIGDKVNILIASANIFTRKVDFSLKN